MRKILTFYLILIAFVSFAQTREIDSLQQALKDFDAKKLELHNNLMLNESDTAKVNTLNALSKQYWQISEYIPAKKYADEAMAIAQQIKFEKGIATSYDNIGRIYDELGNYPEALKSNFASLKLFEEIGDKNGIASSYNNIGIIYKRQGNYPEALKSYFASLKLREETGDKKGIAASYNNIAIIYRNQGNYPEALKNHFASLELLEEIGDKYGIATAYNNIGNVYFGQGNYPEALKNFIAALKLREETGDKKGIAASYNNIGLIYQEQGNYPEALKNYFASLELKQEIGDKYGIEVSYLNIGETKLKMQHATEARNWLMKGLMLAKEIGNKDGIKESYQNLAQVDSALGDFKDAYENHKMYSLYRDSLINEENIKKVTQQQMQYEFDKKEAVAKVEQEKKDAIAARELQKQKLLRNGFVGGFAVVLLFAGVFFTQRNMIKKAKRRSDELLLNILPEEVAAELEQNGSSEAKQFDEVSVMFTDFKDFTLLSEDLSPSELVTQIDYYYKAFDRTMEKYNIEKIKTIGDSYMAAGGLHFRNKTNAADIVKAALEIRRFIEEDARRKQSEGKKVMEIRIGIHTGTVVAGIVGVKKFAYDIWGDTVNIASRMEKTSEPGKVNISGITYELVKDQFNCTYRGKIYAKNKGEIDMYFVEHHNS